MTVTVSASTETFDPNLVDGGPDVLKAAEDNRVPQAQRRRNGMADFTFTATTTTVSEGAAFASAGVNLSTKGVPFPADSMRNIRVKAWFRQETTGKLGYSERVFTVNGGTNPTLAIVPTNITHSPSGTGLLAVNTWLGDGRIVAAVPVGSAATPAYPFAEVAIATTPTPDEVYVRVSAPAALQGGNSLRWKVDVFVEPLVALTAPPA